MEGYSRLDVSFGLEQHYVRGLSKMRVRCGLALVVMLAMLVPAVVALAVSRGMAPFAPALIIYTTAVMGFALPFHNLMILVGAGKVGKFDEQHTLRFFPAQAVVTLLVVGAEIVWWRLLGRI